LPVDAAKAVETALKTIAAATVADKPTVAIQTVAFMVGNADDANRPVLAAATSETGPFDTATMVMTDVKVTAAAAIGIKTSAADGAAATNEMVIETTTARTVVAMPMSNDVLVV